MTSQHLVDRGFEFTFSPQRTLRAQSRTGEEGVGFCAAQTYSFHPTSVFFVLSVVKQLAGKLLDRAPHDPG